MRHLNITISGKVQGVGFRWESKSMAESLRVKGFVKNTADGSLYMEAEGENEDLDKFLSWCRKGPFWAKVGNVKLEESALQNFTSFEIIRN